ncbi:MAG: cation diffusion facilitator family transporter [Candidatus Margulisiibacteriota bacterium]
MDKALEKKQKFAAKVSICGWVIVALVPLAGGLLTDSITLLLDAAQGIVTLGVSVLVYAAVRRMGKPPDENYQYGYDKYGPLTSALQHIMIILTCIICVSFAVQDILHAESITHYGTAVVAALISSLVSIFFAVWIRRMAVVSDSEVLKDSSRMWFLDSALAFGILGGFLLFFLLKGLGFESVGPYIDPLMAIVLALIFMVSPLKPLREDLLDLLDAAPSTKSRDDIKKMIDQVRPRAVNITRLRMRKAGKKVFLEVGFTTDENLSIGQVRDIIFDFEKSLEGKLKNCDIILRYKGAKA